MKAKKHLNLRIPLWWPGGPGWRRLVRWLLPSPGNALFTLLVVAGLLWASNAGALPFRAPMLAGDSTTTISYQGRLADSSGDPVTSSGIGMCFRLYNTDTGGSPLWEECHLAVPVEDGLFHVLLGSTDPIPVSVLANNNALWLGIKVGNDSEMTPREQIASVPYAMIASTVANGAVTTEKIADEAVTQAKLGTDVSLEPPNGSITTEKIADEAVTSAKLEHSGPHIPITPDENGLVKLAVMRQDRTTDVYSNNQVILTGYGYMAGTGGTFLSDSVTFGITFATAPIVVVTNAGYQAVAGTTYAGTTDDGATSSKVYNVSTTGFDMRTWRVAVGGYDTTGTFASGTNFFYTWIAIGTLE